jgi:lysophospholipase L1-like esterase
LAEHIVKEKHLIPPGSERFNNHPWFGRQFMPGQDFIGPDGFISLDEAAATAKASGNRVILNIGDSSTAGWDSRVGLENKKRRAEGLPVIMPLFQYSTYSDLLRDKVGETLVVLNAGIPGHTTLQGVRRQRMLLKALKVRGVTPDYVSFYFGDNDSQWENNLEDKYLLRSNLPLFLDRKRVRNRKPDNERIHLRTSLPDFTANMRSMIRDARYFGAAPMLIMPQTPIYWKPANRYVADNFVIQDDAPAAHLVHAALDKAMALWEQAKDAEWSTQKDHDLRTARELDFLVPRIKAAYRRILESLAREMNLPLIDIAVPREQNDVNMFVDYCHPINAAGSMIVDQLIQAMQAYTEGRYPTGNDLLNRALNAPAMDFTARLLPRRYPSVTVGKDNLDSSSLY